MTPEVSVSVLIQKLLETLRHELQQYGQMLALQDEQQATIMARGAGEVLRSVTAIGKQTAGIQSARQQRESCQLELARSLGKPGEPNFATLIPLLPQQGRVAIESLVSENNQSLVRVQQRVRQNHLLLSRQLALTEQLINILTPSPARSTK